MSILTPDEIGSAIVKCGEVPRSAIEKKPCVWCGQEWERHFYLRHHFCSDACRTKYGKPKRTYEVTAERLHIPVMFWHAKANATVSMWLQSPSKTLVLHGPTGVGKSWQACGALRSILHEHDGHGYLVNCGNLSRIERETYSIYTKTTALALDDLGVRLTPAAIATAYELIEYRISHLLPLIVTTNLTLDALMAIDERIGSRLGAGTWIEITGADRRLG